eukprot:5550533-Alexandrium_andersonii.AAC.1
MDTEPSAPVFTGASGPPPALPPASAQPRMPGSSGHPQSLGPAPTPSEAGAWAAGAAAAAERLA